MNSKELSLLQHLSFLSSCLFHHKIPQKFSKILAPSALPCEKAQISCSTPPGQGELCCCPSAKIPSFYQHPSSTKQETPGFVGTHWAAPKANLIPMAHSSYR